MTQCIRASAFQLVIHNAHVLSLPALYFPQLSFHRAHLVIYIRAALTLPLLFARYTSELASRPNVGIYIRACRYIYMCTHLYRRSSSAFHTRTRKWHHRCRIPVRRSSDKCADTSCSRILKQRKNFLYITCLSIGLTAAWLAFVVERIYYFLIIL